MVPRHCIRQIAEASIDNMMEVVVGCYGMCTEFNQIVYTISWIANVLQHIGLCYGDRVAWLVMGASAAALASNHKHIVTFRMTCLVHTYVYIAHQIGRITHIHSLICQAYIAYARPQPPHNEYIRSNSFACVPVPLVPWIAALHTSLRASSAFAAPENHRLSLR